QCDITKSADLQALVSRAISEFGVLDIMVNNAGIGGTLPWSEENDANLSKTIDINFKAPIEGTRLAVRHFIERGRPGCVVNMSSILAFFPTEFSPVYGAAKSGIANFTACCATLAQRNPPIHVNAVAPSFADTVMVRKLASKTKNNIFDKAGMLTVDEVVLQMIRCIEDESLAGDTIRLMPRRPPLVHKGRKAMACNILANSKL
ncbi:hypothetical protein H4R20_007040, partial [Coemansia guatemalensis]